jgi:hypothetical protein
MLKRKNRSGRPASCHAARCASLSQSVATRRSAPTGLSGSSRPNATCSGSQMTPACPAPMLMRQPTRTVPPKTARASTTS